MKFIRYSDQSGGIHYGAEQADGSAYRIDGDEERNRLSEHRCSCIHAKRRDAGRCELGRHKYNHDLRCGWPVRSHGHARSKGPRCDCGDDRF